jgi:hypothetical protein
MMPEEDRRRRRRRRRECSHCSPILCINKFMFQCEVLQLQIKL